jgi:hypothetical protein
MALSCEDLPSTALSEWSPKANDGAAATVVVVDVAEKVVAVGGSAAVGAFAGIGIGFGGAMGADGAGEVAAVGKTAGAGIGG